MSNKIISEKLLTNVLNVFEILDYDYDDYNKEITYECFVTQDEVDLDEDGNGGSIEKTISLEKLAFKCKDWAVKNGYEIESKYQILFKRGHSLVIDKDGWTMPFIEKTEIEAIIASCEWILKTLEK